VPSGAATCPSSAAASDICGPRPLDWRASRGDSVLGLSCG
jgi:hypothetical protein